MAKHDQGVLGVLSGIVRRLLQAETLPSSRVFHHRQDRMAKHDQGVLGVLWGIVQGSPFAKVSRHKQDRMAKHDQGVLGVLGGMHMLQLVARAALRR